MKNNQKKGFIVPVLLAIIALLVIGGGVYVYQNKKAEAPTVVDTGIEQSDQIQQQTNTKPSPVNTQTNNSLSQSDTSDWKTYTNSEYGFELKYPNDWKFSTYFLNADGFFFTENKAKDPLSLVILPRGEFDHGYEGQPVISNVQISGKQAKKSKWNNSVTYQFVDDTTPSTWIKCGLDLKNCNRIETLTPNQLRSELIDQILSTFKFTK